MAWHWIAASVAWEQNRHVFHPKLVLQKAAL